MSIKHTAVEIIRPAILGLAIFGASSAVVHAQPAQSSMDSCGPSSWSSFDPQYNNVDSWQSGWDSGNYDRNHMILGTVGAFSDYRLTLNSAQGDTMKIDLKNGTVIRPTGGKPTPGQRAAVFGYWSNGTFIANRVILRR
jgi:hypothetical protein